MLHRLYHDIGEPCDCDLPADDPYALARAAELEAASAREGAQRAASHAAYLTAHLQAAWEVISRIYRLHDVREGLCPLCREEWPCVTRLACERLIVDHEVPA